MSSTCSILFNGNLNDFLAKHQKGKPVVVPLKTARSAKDAIESAGVPHVEIGRVIINGRAAPLTTLLQAFDQIVVLPHLGPLPAGTPVSFLADVHLGKLARLLRLLGLDVHYQSHLDDAAISDLAATQNKVVLTRDVGLLKHKHLQYGYWLRSQQPKEQLVEVIERFALCQQLYPFSRCIACNGLLNPATKQQVLPLLLPKTMIHFDVFYQCGDCRRVYWKGSHYAKMEKLVEAIKSVACQ